MKFQPLTLFLKETFKLGLFLSLTVFAWLRLIFFEVPFSIPEDGVNLIKTVLCGWMMMMLLKAAWLLLLYAGQKIERLATRKLKPGGELLVGA